MTSCLERSPSSSPSAGSSAGSSDFSVTSASLSSRTEVDLVASFFSLSPLVTSSVSSAKLSASMWLYNRQASSDRSVTRHLIQTGKGTRKKWLVKTMHRTSCVREREPSGTHKNTSTYRVKKSRKKQVCSTNSAVDRHKLKREKHGNSHVHPSLAQKKKHFRLATAAGFEHKQEVEKNYVRKEGRGANAALEK